MNIFARRERVESEHFNFPKTKENMPDPKAETETKAKIDKAAKDIEDDENHELNKILSNPKWIIGALEVVGVEKGKTLKENLKKAISAISKQTGYSEELIRKVYEIRENRELH